VRVMIESGMHCWMGARNWRRLGYRPGLRNWCGVRCASGRWCRAPAKKWPGPLLDLRADVADKRRAGLLHPGLGKLSFAAAGLGINASNCGLGDTEKAPAIPQPRFRRRLYVIVGQSPFVHFPPPTQVNMFGSFGAAVAKPSGSLLSAPAPDEPVHLATGEAHKPGHRSSAARNPELRSRSVTPTMTCPYIHGCGAQMYNKRSSLNVIGFDSPLASAAGIHLPVSRPWLCAECRRHLVKVTAGPRLHSGTGRPIGILHVVVA